MLDVLFKTAPPASSPIKTAAVGEAPLSIAQPASLPIMTELENDAVELNTANGPNITFDVPAVRFLAAF